MKIIGVDCATQKKKTGLSLATYEEGQCCLQEARTGEGEKSVAEIISDWLLEGETFLLALDAPLGWPVHLGEELHSHQAGESIYVEPNKLFRRMTDKYVKGKIGKVPLDVGADRIARTAHTALSLVGELRELNGMELGVAWDPFKVDKGAIIEVYPAATMKTYGIINSGYKDAGKESLRESMLQDLKGYIEIDTSLDTVLVSNADVLDSAFCVLAGIDFLKGQVYMPADKQLVRTEGWIWFRKA